jgi:transposase-like protein
MPKRLPDTKREAILADISPGASRNAIARKHGVSASFVGKVATEAGMDDAWNRTHTEKAAHAKAVDNKARRAQLESDLLDDAQHFRKRARSPYEVVVSTVQGAEVITLSEPPLTDVRSALTAIGICIDKGLAIEKHDTSDDGADHAKSMLGRLFTGLAEAVGTEPAETPQDED